MREKQLLTLITSLQQQVATLLQQNKEAKIEVAKPPLFERKMEEVSMFINVIYLYLSIKMTKEQESIKITQVLSYVQGEVVEVQKDNLLDELLEGELELKTVEELFKKIKNKFGKTTKEKRKVEQLRTIKQGERTCNKYIQEFKKTVRESRYKRQSLIEEFKKGLNEAIRRKLAETETPPSTIEKWQERSVQLDRNQRQSRVKERVLGKNIAYPQRNAQPKRRGLYRGREGQITWRTGDQYRGGFQNRGSQLEPVRDPNAMDVNRERKRNRICFVYEKWDHITKNCQQRKGRERRIVGFQLVSNNLYSVCTQKNWKVN